MNLPLRGTRLLKSCHDNKSVLLLTTAFVLILSPTALQQVTDLKREKETLEEKLGHVMKEKAVLEGEVEELKGEREDLISDVETLKEWGESLVKAINRDFNNLFDDIKNEKNLFVPGTDHTDNCDVSVLNYGLFKACKFTRNCYSNIFTETVVDAYCVHVYTGYIK